MRRKYRVTRGDFIDPELDHVFVPDITVYDREDQWVKTGLLDADGKPIEYLVPGMEPIGFIHYPEEDDDQE